VMDILGIFLGWRLRDLEKHPAKSSHISSHHSIIILIPNKGGHTCFNSHDSIMARRFSLAFRLFQLTISFRANTWKNILIKLSDGWIVDFTRKKTKRKIRRKMLNNLVIIGLYFSRFSDDFSFGFRGWYYLDRQLAIQWGLRV
jgi:hypothetical protein